MSQEINYQSLGKRRVLVAEDVELNQYLARHIMESWGFEVEIAINGLEALLKVQENEFDLILMDIHMPEMDGMQATENIRALVDKKISQIPIIALTANALKGDSEKYLAVGMNDYLSKPFDEPGLFEVISKNLTIARPQVSSSNSFDDSAYSTYGIRSNELKDNYRFDLVPNETSAVESEIEKSVSVGNGPVEINMPAGEKLYSLAMVEDISGGDQDFVKRMVQLFLDTMPDALNDLELATRDRHWEALSKLAHKLKSTIDSMGITSLKQLVRTIESNGKTGADTEQIPALVSTLVVTMKSCLDQVKKDFSL